MTQSPHEQHLDQDRANGNPVADEAYAKAMEEIDKPAKAAKKTVKGPQDVIDRMASAVENERLQRRFTEDLDEEPFTQIRDWAESLSNVAEQVDEARDAVEEWTLAEDREEKADAKERALEALSQLVDEWNGCPLNLSALEAFNGDED